MKQTSYDVVFAAALQIVRNTHPTLEYILSEQEAATCLTQIYWSNDTTKVNTQHYSPVVGNVNTEITIITTREILSIIGATHAHCYNNGEPYITYEDLNTDLETINTIIQMVLQFVL